MAQVHHDTHALPMGNYVIGVGNYVIATPSEVGNYKIADKQTGSHQESSKLTRCVKRPPKQSVAEVSRQWADHQC